MTAPHVTIVGAGMVGMSTAAFLRRSGCAVTVIDRVLPGEGCSFGNAGGIAFAEVKPMIHLRVLLKVPGWLLDPLGPLTIRWSYLPKALPWFLAAGRNAYPSRVREITVARAALSHRAVSDLETLLGMAGKSDLLVKVDALRLYDSEAQYDAEEPERRAKHEHGYRTVRLSPGEIVELEPDVARDFACGSLHGGWYHVRNPQAVVSAIAEQFVRAGGEIIRDEVVGVEMANSRAVSLPLKEGGPRRLDRLIVCAGAYSNFFARLFGDKILLDAERGYHLQMPNPHVELGRTLTCATSRMAIAPLDAGLRLAGTDEFAGLDAAPNWKRADVLWRTAKRCLPSLRAVGDADTRWMGRRPGMPDGLPVIGPSGKPAMCGTASAIATWASRGARPLDAF
jgi:glycine/D-amino acid oxidase-like deaminating enzyme